MQQGPETDGSSPPGAAAWRALPALLLGFLAALPLALTLSACAPGAQGPLLSKALLDLNQQFVAYGYFDPFDLMPWLPASVQSEAQQAIRFRQCTEWKADPILFLPQPGRLTLTGGFTENGQVTVTGISPMLPASASSAAGLGLTTTSGYRLEFPYALTTLTALPRAALGDLTAAPEQGIDAIAKLKYPPPASDPAEARIQALADAALAGHLDRIVGAERDAARRTQPYSLSRGRYLAAVVAGLEASFADYQARHAAAEEQTRTAACLADPALARLVAVGPDGRIGSTLP
jgi:hypothetical protein